MTLKARGTVRRFSKSKPTKVYLLLGFQFTLKPAWLVIMEVSMAALHPNLEQSDRGCLNIPDPVGEPHASVRSR